MFEFDVDSFTDEDEYEEPVQILSVRNDLIFINKYSNIDNPQHKRSRVNNSLSDANCNC